MKKTIAIIICITTICLSLCSCRREENAYDLLCEFTSAYGADGVIYSPNVPEGKEGYIYDGLMERIYIYSGSLPANYAVMLNSRTDVYSECGIFICSDAEMPFVEEMCLERVWLLAEGEDHAFVKRSKHICFYSTLRDRSRAEKIFSEIIR